MWTVSIPVKAYSLSSMTVVREGMSACEDRVIPQPSRVMDQGPLNEKLICPSIVSEVSLGKSIPHSVSSQTLRMINSVESSSSLKQTALSPSRMEVNSGKSSHHLFLIDSLSNTTREQLPNALSPKNSVFKLGKSIHHFIL